MDSESAFGFTDSIQIIEDSIQITRMINRSTVRQISKADSKSFQIEEFCHDILDESVNIQNLVSWKILRAQQILILLS